jgi:mannan endo-1,4-beta-mannosidase
MPFSMCRFLAYLNALSASVIFSQNRRQIHRIACISVRHRMKVFSVIILIVVSLGMGHVKAQDITSSSSNVNNNQIIMGVPVNQNTSSEAKAVLHYLNALSTDELPGVISGELTGVVTSIPTEFKTSIADLQQKTGKWVGMISLEYEFSGRATPVELTTANKILTNYWQQGGLISIGWAPVNPWTDKPNWPFDDEANARSKMEELVTPGSPVYEKWQNSLARIADGLSELQKAKVVVLWRPFYEMNGFWYWYGTTSHFSDPQPFTKVYWQIFDYFTKERGLDNLLWVYAPSHFASCGDPRCKPVEWAYPGDDVIDIVGGTSYGNAMRIADYEAYTKFKKPLIMSEYAPDESNSKGFNNTIYAERLLKEYPRIASWTSWGGISSMNVHDGAEELLNSPGIINRDTVDWKRYWRG